MKTTTLLSILLVVFTLTSCHKDRNLGNNTEATSVQLTKPTVSLVVGGREKLLTIVEPVGATVSDAKWTSSNPSVATINEKGIINALMVGQTTITLTSGNKPTEQCTLSVIASPIAGLVMPEIDYPIAKEAIVILQGTGFKTGDKIWLRKVTGTGLTLKSGQTSDDILAQIVEQAENYISFYCAATSGWYSVVLEKDNTQYELGNMDIETPNIPEYVYDKNKIFWEDTHWRRFQLRGKVKEMKTIDEYYPYWTEKNTYIFNEKGYLKTAVETNSLSSSTSSFSSTYEYDNSNRLIKKAEDCNIGYDGNINHLTVEYTYGNHNLFIPLDIGPFTPFQPYWYDPFYLSSFVDYQQRFNLDMWQKGIIGIKEELHYTSGKTVTNNYNFNISDNIVTASTSNLMGIYKENYIWNYNSEMPYKAVISTTYTDGSVGTQTNKYIFSPNGTPINSETILGNGSNIRTLPSKFVENCPFSLLASLNDSKGYGPICNCEYDINWDLTKYDDSIVKVTFNYTSYDVYGNWIQCTALGKDKDGHVQISRLTREITYW